MILPKRTSIVIFILIIWNCIISFYIFKILGNIALVAKAILLLKEARGFLL